MTVLVVCVGEGKGTWKEVYDVVSEDWEKIFVVTQDFFKDRFRLSKPHELIIIDVEKEISVLVDELKSRFGSLFGDVAVSLASGSGKEHMAVLAALLKCGAGIRLVVSSEKGAIAL